LFCETHRVVSRIVLFLVHLHKWKLMLPLQREMYALLSDGKEEGRELIFFSSKLSLCKVTYFGVAHLNPLHCLTVGVWFINTC
jgi:hypothetical protein